MRTRDTTDLAALGLALLGLLVSVYLTIEHFTGSTSLACSGKGTVNCLAVTTSKWSHLAGIPVAVLGIVFFVVMLGLCAPSVWALPDPRVQWVRIGVAGLGVVTALYLLWAELFGVGAICLWCTSVHLVTVALFAVVLARRPQY